MASKQILYSDEARQKMKKGIETLARTVKTTLGATGRNVMFEKGFGAPTVTKDGVTVAKEVERPDPTTAGLTSRPPPQRRCARAWRDPSGSTVRTGTRARITDCRPTRVARYWNRCGQDAMRSGDC